MIIGLTGAAGSGKDSVADILVAEHGFQRMAFADCLYEEVSTVFNVPVEFLKNRKTKEKRSFRLSLGHCMDGDFARVVREIRHGGNRPIGHSSIPYSPRQILQWWGDYRRAQCESYLIDKVSDRLITAPGMDWAIVGVRAQNEANLVQEFGGQLGLVLRPGVEPVANHDSEEFWKTCRPDIVIRNDGTLDDLMADVCAMAVVLQKQSAFTSVTPGADLGADAGDDYTLADTILARKILLNLGFAMHPSMEPGADERVDRVAKMLADAKAEANLQTQSFNLVAHLHHQRDFSLRTFGPGDCAARLLDHIRKELLEIEASPTDITEWVDVVMMALDGAWRAGYTPEAVAQAIADKQGVNEARQWPDWQKSDPDKAMEHVRQRTDEG